MASDFIPEDLARFITDRIESVAQLEALLLLRTDPGHHWTIEALAKRLYTQEGQTAELMSRLAADAMATADSNEPPGYFYDPQDPETKELINRVAAAYPKHLVPITNLIHSKPRSRVQEFADAFRLRKDPT
jgi:hypothetical protein